MFRGERVAVVTDSTSDLPRKMAHDNGVDIVPLGVTFDISKGEVYRDGEDITPKEFFDKLAESRVFPKTNAPSPGDFSRAYNEVIEQRQTRSIFSIHLLEEYSNTVGHARLAVELLTGANPQKAPNILVKDSGQVSLGLGIVALRAAKLAEKRMKLAEINEEIADLRPSIYTVCVLPNLEYARRGGRLDKVKLAMSYVGSLLHIVPIMQIHNGRIAEIGRTRVKKRIDELLNLVLTKFGDIRFEEVAVVHGSAPSDAQKVREVLATRAKKDLGVFDLGPTVGAHGGPGTVGVAILLPPRFS